MAPGELGRVIGRQGRTAAGRAHAGRRGRRARRRQGVASISATTRVRSRLWNSGEPPATTSGDFLSRDRSLIGRIVRPQGNRGEVVVAPETDFGGGAVSSRARSASSCATAQPATADGRARAASTAAAGWSGSRASDDRRGRDAARPRAADSGATRCRPLEPGAYYVHDLVGCEVRDGGGQRGRRRGAGRYAGRARRMLVVAASRGEVLVPLRRARFAGASTSAGKRIVIDPPEGLIELNSRRRAAMIADVITIFPAMVEAALAEGVVGRARERGRGRRAGARPARLHRRSAPDGGRRAVRRRAGHGDEARAAVPRGRGDRRRARARRPRWC